MAWLDNILKPKNKPTQCNTAQYPSRTFRKILCSQPHCTDACFRPHTDPYRFWALFLAQRHIDYDGLFANIASIPSNIRFSAYLHVLMAGCTVKEIGAAEGEIVKEGDEDERDIIDRDSELVKKIFYKCRGIDPEGIFKIYKAIEREYPVDANLLEIMCILADLPEAEEHALYNILRRLIEEHGLITAFGNGEEDNGVVESKKDDKKENKDESLKDREEDNGVVENKKDDKKEGKDENLKESNQSDTKDDDKKNNIKNNRKCNSLPPETIKKIWSIILKDKKDIFIQITDLVISLNCTYAQIMNRASAISLYKDAAPITTVLASKANNHYYSMLKNSSKPKPKKRITKESYFDFIVIQNELIKAQENIKNQLNERIAQLEDENRSLREAKGIERDSGEQNVAEK